MDFKVYSPSVIDGKLAPKDTPVGGKIAIDLNKDDPEDLRLYIGDAGTGDFLFLNQEEVGAIIRKLKKVRNKKWGKPPTA